MPFKRYLAFAGNRYYPGEGLYDFIDSFDSKHDAISAAKQALPNFYGWAMVFDSQSPTPKEPIWEESNDE